MFNYSVREIVSAMAGPHMPDIPSSGLRCHHNITRGLGLKDVVVLYLYSVSHCLILCTKYYIRYLSSINRSLHLLSVEKISFVYTMV